MTPYPASLLFTVLMLLASPALHAQDFWVPANEGLAGAAVGALDLDSDGRIYASTAAGIFRSDDGGRSWRQLPLLPYFPLVSTAIAPNGVIHAAAYDSIYTSHDHGESWIARSLGSNAYGYFRLLGFDGAGYLYATNGNVIRSSDGGEAWDTVVADLRMPGNLTGTSFAVPDLMLLATASDFLLSSDGGKNWFPRRGPTTAGASDFTAAEAIPGGTILVGTPAGLFRSTDRAASWIRVDTLPVHSLRAGSDGSIYQIFGNPVGYVTIPPRPMGVRASSDQGATWRTVRDGRTAQILADGSGNLIVATDAGVERSSDGGVSWSASNRGLANIQAGRFVQGPGGVIATIVARRMAFSSDNGASWSVPSGEDLSQSTVLGFLPDGSLLRGTSQVYGDTGRIDRSTDQGGTWTPLIHGLVGVPTSIVRGSDGDMFVGTMQSNGFTSGRGSIYHSADNGATWNAVGFELPVTEVAIRKSGEIFALSAWYTDSGPPFTGGALHRSTDGGVHWTTLNDSLEASAIVIDRKGTIYTDFDLVDWNNVYNSGHHILRSTDNGDSWSASPLRITGHSMVDCLAIDSAGTIYAGTRYGGIFRSTDEGASWNPFNSGLTNLQINSIAVTPAGYIVVATVDNGIFRSRIAPVAHVAVEPTAAPGIFPNPASRTATIRFTAPADGVVRIALYNAVGEEVATVLNGRRAAGSNEARFDVSGLANGVYVCRITMGGSVTSSMMVVSHSEE